MNPQQSFESAALGTIMAQSNPGDKAVTEKAGKIAPEKTQADSDNSKTVGDKHVDNVKAGNTQTVASVVEKDQDDAEKSITVQATHDKVAAEEDGDLGDPSQMEGVILSSPDDEEAPEEDPAKSEKVTKKVKKDAKAQKVDKVDKGKSLITAGGKADTSIIEKSNKASKSSEVDEEIDNEQVNEVSHLKLNRHIYTILESDGQPGNKINTRKQLESEDCPYWAWPLYNDFKSIIKNDKDTWPPAHVNLQDWHVLEILRMDISRKECHKRWPADFKGDGNIQPKRRPKGRAAKIRYSANLHYAVVCHTYQLSGDEGCQVLTHLPPRLGAPDDQPRTVVEVGQLCEIQEDFQPSLEELRKGTLLSRLTNGVLRSRPLNNRGDYGPENRPGNPPVFSSVGKRVVKKEKNNDAPESAYGRHGSKAVSNSKTDPASSSHKQNNKEPKASSKDQEEKHDDGDDDSEQDDNEPIRKLPSRVPGQKRPSSSSSSDLPSRTLKRTKLDVSTSSSSKKKKLVANPPLRKVEAKALMEEHSDTEVYDTIVVDRSASSSQPNGQARYKPTEDQDDILSSNSRTSSRSKGISDKAVFDIARLEEMRSYVSSTLKNLKASMADIGSENRLIKNDGIMMANGLLKKLEIHCEGHFGSFIKELKKYGRGG